MVDVTRNLNDLIAGQGWIVSKFRNQMIQKEVKTVYLSEYKDFSQCPHLKEQVNGLKIKPMTEYIVTYWMKHAEDA